MLPNGQEIAENMRKHFAYLGVPSDAMIGTFTVFKAITPVPQSAPNLIESRGFLTTDETDSVGDVLIQDGGNWGAYFDRNKVLFADHQYDVLSQVATVRRRKLVPMAGNRLGWEIHSAINADSDKPKVRAVAEGVREGTIGMSIGFEATDWGPPTSEERKQFPGASNIIRKWNPIEGSFTYMPCNVSCRAGMAFMDGEAVKHIAGRTLPELVRKHLLLPELASANLSSVVKPRVVLLID